MILSAVWLLIPALLLGSGQELETAGAYAEAGMAYEEDGDVPGQVRILSRFLEESLYAGRSRHAIMLLQYLKTYPLEPGYIDFWYARLAWTMGLPELACTQLEELSTGPWLSLRASGFADQYRCEPDSALLHHRMAWNAAESDHQRFWSTVDIVFTLIQQGSFSEAEHLSTRMAVAFPRDGLPVVGLALASDGLEQYGRALTILQELSSDTTRTGITRSMAQSLLEEMI